MQLKFSLDFSHCTCSLRIRPEQELTRWILSFSNGKYITVFQAEVYAIKACKVEILKRAYRNRNMYILSDSQVAIKALDNYWIKSKLVGNCHQ
jgi:hypothetical protein